LSGSKKVHESKSRKKDNPVVAANVDDSIHFVVVIAVYDVTDVIAADDDGVHFVVATVAIAVSYVYDVIAAFDDADYNVVVTVANFNRIAANVDAAAVHIVVVNDFIAVADIIVHLAIFNVVIAGDYLNSVGSSAVAAIVICLFGDTIHIVDALFCIFHNSS